MEDLLSWLARELRKIFCRSGLTWEADCAFREDVPVGESAVAQAVSFNGKTTDRLRTPNGHDGAELIDPLNGTPSEDLLLYEEVAVSDRELVVFVKED